MSSRNAKNKAKIAVLDEINQIDRRLKKKKIREDAPLEEMEKLLRRRDALREKLKTNRKLNKIR